MKLPAVFQSRASKARNSFIASSFESSKHLSERLNFSGSSDPKSHPHSMKFHKDWRHPSCGVMEWYNRLDNTQFTSIQHWQNLDTTYMHEFLVIQLTDGSACQVERMGDGSRANAIRRIGCTAYDLIQWFSKEANRDKKWSTGLNKLVVQVEFPRPFDLLDVLAVCYTIQHNFKRASVYTLQRYNCYFLCNTILAMLTRRIGEWESFLTGDEWPGLLEDMLGDLRAVSSMPMEKQSPIDYLAVGICSLLEPDSLNPAGFIFDQMQLLMQTGGKTHDFLIDTYCQTLWHEQHHPVLYGESGDYALSHLLKNEPELDYKSGLPSPDSSPQNAQLDALLYEPDEVRYPQNDIDLAAIDKLVSREAISIASMFAKEFAELGVDVFEMQHAEERPPIYVQLVTSILTPVLGCTILWPAMWGNITLRFEATVSKLISAIPLTTWFKLLKALAYQYQAGDEGNPELETSRRLDGFADSAIEHAAKRMCSILLQYIQPHSGEPNLRAALAILNCYLPLGCWKTCLRRCVARRVDNAFRASLAHKPTISTRFEESGPGSELSVSDFQSFIRERIDKHAERVASYRLAAAGLVSINIKNSMTDIWKSLPRGFGANVVDTKTTSEHPLQTNCTHDIGVIVDSDACATSLFEEE